MFQAIRDHWKQSRDDVLQKEAADVLARYQRLDGQQRYELVSAFDYTKANTEIEHGPVTSWTPEFKLAVGNGFVEGARKSWRESPAGANGLALLGLYLEAQTLPGDKASRVVQEIGQWHRRAVAADIQRDVRKR